MAPACHAAALLGYTVIHSHAITCLHESAEALANNGAASPHSSPEPRTHSPGCLHGQPRFGTGASQPSVRPPAQPIARHRDKENNSQRLSAVHAVACLQVQTERTPLVVRDSNGTQRPHIKHANESVMKQSKFKKPPTRDNLAAALPCVVKIVTDCDDVGSAEEHKSGWFGNRDGQALRRRALAGELCGLLSHKARHPQKRAVASSDVMVGETSDLRSLSNIIVLTNMIGCSLHILPRLLVTLPCAMKIDCAGGYHGP